MGNNKGFSLVELIVVMAIFIGVIIMTSMAFENILGKAGQQTKSAESQIEGIVGLEMLRYDIEHAGYGLFGAFKNMSSGSASAASYTEATSTAGAPGVNSTAFNDSPPNAPRAIVPGVASNGTDYLVIKSALSSMSSAARRWSYANYSSNGNSYIKKWGGKPNDIQSNDRVITLNSAFDAAGVLTRQLVVSISGQFFYDVGTVGTLPMIPIASTNVSFRPTDSTQNYMVYTITNNANPAMPYNRSDYFVMRPASGMPTACNAGTGILYKGQANHSGGFTPLYPMLDCVGDMQVVFQLDMDGDGTAGTYAGLDASGSTQVISPGEARDGAAVVAVLGDGTATHPGNPTLIRQQLKTVHVYILMHEGGKDRNFSYPGDSIVVGDPTMPSLGRVWTAAQMATTFGTDWRQYRWKVFTLSIRPKNLN